MSHKLLCAFVLVGSIVMESPGQSSKPVPVYPGAKLVTESEEGAECCDFITTDALDKVVAFYEKQLKTKGMDTKALAAAYPAVKAQVQMLEQQLPPGAKLRAFVLEEVTANGQKSPVLFELLSTSAGVRFSIGDAALAGNDAQFARTWREKTGKLTEEEKMKQESDQNQATEDKEQKERDARRAKEEPKYFAAMTAELVKLLRQNKVDLAPGLQCEGVERQEGESSSAYAFYFAATGDFQKVYDFYASRTKPAPVSNMQGNGAGWLKEDHVNFWRTAEFAFGNDLRIQVQEMSQTMEGAKTTAVLMRVTSEEVQTKLQKIREEFESRW